MAQEQIPLFNFYRRYKWAAQDFTDWQTGMVSLGRGVFDGLFHGAVMDGFDLTAVSGMTLQASSGIAVGPSGYLMVEASTNNVVLTAPVSNVRKDLLVVRPKLVDNTVITRPTAPFDPVYLKQLQDAELVLIAGTASATPEYPSIQANDVIIAGIRTQSGQVSIAVTDVDLEIRDIYGKNSDFQENFGKYDDRCRPYRNSALSLGLKPSQLSSPFPKAFSYVNKTTPSIFPKTGGVFTNADTFLNFQTGAITGGDGTSADFTPVIPTTGNWINASVSLLSDDTLAIAYGTQGTRAQCIAGITNQTTVGAGSVTLTTNSKLLCFVMVKSPEGTTISELEFTDARGISAVGVSGGGLGSGGVTTPAGGSFPLTLTAADDGKVIGIDTSAARTINAHAAASGFKITFKDISGLAGTNTITFVRNGAQKIEFLSANYLMKANYGNWTFEFNGTDWLLVA